MSEGFEVSRVIPARAERIYNAWLSAQEHGAMAGGTAATYEPDGRFTAWDGYISGKTLESEENRRIVQAWRTTEFPEGAADSRLEVLLEETGDNSTRVTFRHSEFPEGQGESYRSGFEEHYFDHMQKYFAGLGSRVKEAGEALSQAAEDAGDAIEAAGEKASDLLESAGERAERAVSRVKKTAKKSAASAGKKVKGLIAKAKSRLSGGKKKVKVKAKAKRVVAKKKPAKAKPKAKKSKSRR